MVRREGDDNQLSVNVGIPWKKIIFYGILIIVFGGITKIITNYLNTWGLDFSFSEDFIPIIQKPILYYPLFLVIISLIVFLIVLKKRNEGKNRIGDRDIKKVLKIVDKLLKKLPKKEVDKFAKTADSKLYFDVMKKYGLN